MLRTWKPQTSCEKRRRCEFHNECQEGSKTYTEAGFAETVSPVVDAELGAVEEDAPLTLLLPLTLPLLEVGAWKVKSLD